MSGPFVYIPPAPTPAPTPPAPTPFNVNAFLSGFRPYTTALVTQTFIPRGRDFDATQGTEREASASPAGGVLPVPYGRRKIPGLFVYLQVIGEYLHGIWLFGEGELDACEILYINDKDASTYSSGDVYSEVYRGTSGQTVCGLSAHDANWTYPLADIAYVYLKLAHTDNIQGMPKVEGLWRGKKVYDPRTGNTLYSANPALHMADMLTSTRYGGRLASAKMDWSSVSDAANRCDDLISGSKRFEMHYYFGSAITLKDAIDTARLHFMAAPPLHDNGIYRFELAKPKPVSASYVEAEVWNLQIHEMPASNSVNIVRWTWTDPTSFEAVTETLEDPSLGTYDEIHERQYDLTGSQSLSQSKRIATFLLNSRLSDLSLQFDTYNYKGLQPADLITLTHGLGLSAKQLIITDIETIPDKAYRIFAREYDPAMYSDAVVSEPTYADTTLPDPASAPTDVTGLTLAENVTQSRDGTWIAEIRATWNPSATPSTFIRHYEVWLQKDGTGYSLLGITTGNSWFYGPAEELSTYDLKVVCVSRWNIKSTGTTQQIIPQGKQLEPTWKGGASLRATEAGDVVILAWSMADGTAPAVDLDIVGYEIRRGRPTDAWATATFITIVDSLTYLDKNCPSGDWRYFLRAKDSVGNYTATDQYADVSVTLNPYFGFQQNRDADVDSGGTLNNVGVGFGFVVPVDSSYNTWSERFPGTAWNTGVGGTYTYWSLPAVATADFTSAQADLGQIVSGRWSVTYGSTKLGTGTATITPKLLLSANGTDWTTYTASSPFNATARYFKVKFEFTSSALDTQYVVYEPVVVTIQADPKEEYGEATVSGSGSLSITFTESFNSIEKITLTPMGSSARIALADNLTTSGFTLMLFDAAGAAAGGTVRWKVEGF